MAAPQVGYCAALIFSGRRLRFDDSRHVSTEPQSIYGMQKHSIHIAWAQLVRLPNLLTVPGDPLAGYLLIADALFKLLDE